jgi:hypothetical protein
VIAVSARRIVNLLVSYLDDDQQATTDQMTTALLRHLPKPTGQESLNFVDHPGVNPNQRI